MTEDRRAAFFALVRRANQLGTMLPAREDLDDLDDEAALAEVELILAEFDRTVEAIKDLRLRQLAPRRRREAGGSWATPDVRASWSTGLEQPRSRAAQSANCCPRNCSQMTGEQRGAMRRNGTAALKNPQ
jgi:hypothetical protein